MARHITFVYAMALLCFLAFSLQFLDTQPPYDPVADALFLGIIVVAGACALLLWWRTRLRSARAKSTVSVVIVAIMCVVSAFGSVGLATPLLVLAFATLVVDTNPRLAIIFLLTSNLGWVALSMAFGRSALEAVINGVPLAVLMAIGIVLGLMIRANEVNLASKDEAIRERDALLAELREKSLVEKSLMLSEERRRAASDLHDGLGHRLTHVSMALDFARRVCDQNPDAAWREIASAHETSRDAMEYMRMWVRALSPVKDPELRGIRGLETIAQSFRGTGVDIRVTSELEDADLTDKAELLMYRTVQESLTNALRHAKATRVDIRLFRAENGHISIAVSNPWGADARRENSVAYGFGLSSLDTEARGLGGALTTRSSARDGFVTCVSIPSDQALAKGAA